VIDHYRILGIDPGADGAAIRARYVAEMKRAHPDRNASPDTLRRAQELTAAYAVLGDPERREIYDCQRAALERWERLGEGGAARRRFGAGSMLALLLAGLASGAAWYFPRIAPPGIVAERPAPMAAAGPESARCAALARDPGVRGALSDSLERAGLGPLALTALAASAIDLSRPTADEAGEGCRATLRIDLPAGFSAGGGERSIVSDVNLSRSPGGSDERVAIDPDRALVAALATVRVAASTAPPPALGRPDPMMEEVEPVAPDPVAPPFIAPPALPRRAPLEAARTRPERVSPPPAALPAPAQRQRPAVAAPRIDIAPLERQGRAFFTQAWANAGPAKRARLSASQNAFNARLTACGSDTCRRDTYLARNVEISRIMMGE
jgi:curved DNA-binding protein CbpA